MDLQHSDLEALSLVHRSSSYTLHSVRHIPCTYHILWANILHHMLIVKTLDGVQRLSDVFIGQFCCCRCNEPLRLAR